MNDDAGSERGEAESERRPFGDGGPDGVKLVGWAHGYIQLMPATGVAMGDEGPEGD